MKIAFISDTHCKHNLIDEYIRNADIDILIHSGDGANTKVRAINNNELRDCLTWMESFTHIDHKIYVPGNHDTSFESGLVHKTDFKNIDFLINDWIQIYPDGDMNNKPITIYGSPFTPNFGSNWAYNSNRNKISKHWELIPLDTDILVTHGPPKGILDHTFEQGNMMLSVGCKSLLNKVLEIQPKIHAFGHLHDEGLINNHGIKKLGSKCQTKFINSSIVNLRHQVVNKPIIIEY